jgi:signal transduction histidine kinase
MRARLILLVAATTSLVLVAFLVPLALLVRTAAADRAVSGALVKVQTLAPTVATADLATLRLVVARTNADGGIPVSVFLPDGQVIGSPATRSAAVDLAGTGRSMTVDEPGGREILVAVAGLPAGTAVIRTFVPDAALGQGVTRAWLVLLGLGAGLLLVSCLVADQLGRALTRSMSATAEVSHQLAEGNLAARARPGGPPEVRRIGIGLNRLAARIDDLLAAERELVADLSHRLRTPLTALRVDTDALADPEDRARIGGDVDAVERTVNTIIWDARHPARPGVQAACDATEIVAERVRFWSVLAEEERRRVEVRLPADPIVVRASRDDLTACVDALLGNIFAHTPEGCPMAISLSIRPGGGAVLIVADRGPGLPDLGMPHRGRSGSGSTGLGLDIVRRVATGSGGAMVLGGAAGEGAVIMVDLGAPPAAVRR